jgi:hypothetical protein
LAVSFHHPKVEKDFKSSPNFVRGTRRLTGFFKLRRLHNRID